MNPSVIGNTIAFGLENLSAVLFLVALVCAAVGRRRPATDRLLAARFIGWQDSPFQFEVGVADLAIGVAGCAAFGADLGFKAATVLVNAIFLLGDAAGHVRQMLAADNFAPGNAGPVFYLDVILPLATIILLVASARDREPVRPPRTKRFRSF